MHATDYITLGEAAKLAPGRPSANCIWRWCRKGVLSRAGQRVRLRHVRIGGKIFTKAEWLNEFGQSLAAADAEHFDLPGRQAGLDNAPSLPTPGRRPRTDGQRQAAIERAERELREAGV